MSSKQFKRGSQVVFLIIFILFTAGCEDVEKNFTNLFSKKEPSPEIVETTPPVQGKLEFEEGNRLSNIAEQAIKGVVNVSSVKIIRYQNRGPFSPFHNDPFFRFFFDDNFFNRNRVPREKREQSLGSAVVVGKNGYILTNNHVVQDAEEVKIFLHDGKEKTAKIIGTDPKTDIAILKIDLEKDEEISPLPLGDSEKLRLGEVVLAIGNPFGVGQTVTMGIVSATGRANVGVADYEDFIQTDAAINPGNSGGALINMKGELIGINTAIYSRSGGYQGIGFAVPVNMARSVMDSLVRFGKIERGSLGVLIQDVSPDIAKVFGMARPHGALISDVVKDSPAEKAKFKRGDIVIEMDGKEISDAAHLRNMVAQRLIGETSVFKVLRDGKEIQLKAKIERLDTDEKERPEVVEEKTSGMLDGVSVKDFTVVEANQLGIDPFIKGVLVTRVKRGSKADVSNIKPGDIIMEINKTRIHNVETYEKTLKKYKGDNLVLLLNRKNRTFFVVIK